MKREGVLWAVVLVAVAALFLWISGALVAGGVGYADDAWFAVTAKTLALGQGFARPINSDELVAWDPLITTGPPMVVLGAVFVRLLGVLDELPGALVLVTFAVQVALACALLRRRYSFAATAAFGATLLFLLMLATTRSWFFAIGIGEGFAFGFVMLAIVAVATLDSRIGVVLAGIFAGLAVATKLIALFPILGIGITYLLLTAREEGRRLAVSRSVAFGLGVAAPLSVIELFKFLSLGLARYLDYWPAVSRISNVPGTPPDEYLARFGAFLGVINAMYLPLYAVGVLVAGGIWLAWRGLPRPTSERPWHHTTLLALGAMAAHFAYVALASTLYSRYFWIGMALGMLSLATLMLAARTWTRLVAFGTVIALALVTGTAGTWLSFSEGYDQAASEHAERVRVVALVEQRPATPFVAQAQTSVYDIVYLNSPGGRWSFGRDVARFQGQSVVAIINDRFTDRAGDFYGDVLVTCASLTPGHKLIEAYDCGESFWQRYLPSTPMGAIPTEWAAGGALDQGARCNIDTLDGHEQPAGTITLRDPRNLWMFGWAADPASGSSPAATYVVAQGMGGAYYAPVVLENRPGLVRALGGPAFERSAFRVSIDASNVPHGEYQVQLATQTNGHLKICPIAVRFVV